MIVHGIRQSYEAFLSGVEVVQATAAALEAAEALNTRNSVFSVIDRSGALRAAEASQCRYAVGSPRGPLDGAVVSVKDVLLTRGLPTLRGSRAVPSNQAWDIDAPVVARLRIAGAVILGKTTTSELGWKGVTDSRLCGATSNPHDASCTSGGSSGGAAVAVQQGIGCMSLGTDGGGSIRIPAAFCGVVGFKPTYGRLPLYPLGPVGRLVHVGPLTLSVSDARISYQALAGPSPIDATSLPVDTSDTRGSALSGRRCALIRYSSCGIPVEPAVHSALEHVLRALTSAGVEIQEYQPLSADLEDVYWTLWAVGHAVMIRRAGYEMRALDDPGLLRLIEEGQHIDGAQFLSAQVRAIEFASEISNAMSDIDFLLMPTVPILPFRLGDDVPSGSALERWAQWTPFTYPFNLSEQPAISIPVNCPGSDMPIGVQLVGRRYEDLLLLDMAEQLETLLSTICGNV
jgi:aspartyl-tRNA(Asn)/glutamyl-tRNA(Gln) amidotransferase subunit A